MKDLFELAYELQRVFDARKWKYSFIGGMALQHWGEPRLTRDVDVTLLTGFDREEEYISELVREYEGRVPHAADFAARNRVLLLKSASGIGIDIALGGLPFEERLIERAVLQEFLPGRKLRICTAEDLIVMKAFADRDRDWLDINGILTRQGDRLRWQTVWDELRPLCELKESPHILDRLARLREDLWT